MFLKRQGLSTAAAATRTLSNQSFCFFGHFVSILHSIHQTRYLVGRELTTLEINEDAHNPYLGNLCKDNGESLADILENIPNLTVNERNKHGDILIDVVANPVKEERERPISQTYSTNLPLDSKKMKAMARMAEIGTDGQLPSNTLYLMDIGLDMDQIKEMARRYPSIIYGGLERKIKPLVEFFLDLGMPPSNIPNILYKMPQICDMSLSENIIPSMAYIETFGLDKSQWPRVIKQFSPLLTCSKQKVKAAVYYLYELGLSGDRIGKVLTRRPQIIGYSIEDNLRPTAEYFRSIGVNLTSLVGLYPQVLSLSVECNLKPTTKFFLDKGYSIDDVGMIASRYGSLYSLSLTKNLIPKWDFFLTMDYPRSELVKYPNYFGLSLERRIKPRYALMRECDVKLPMSRLLAPSDSDLHKILNRMKKKKTMQPMLDVQL